MQPARRKRHADCLPHFYQAFNLTIQFQEVAEDMELCWQELLALFFIALGKTIKPVRHIYLINIFLTGFAIVIMLLLIVAVKVVVILSLVIGIIVCLVATAYLW